MSIIYKHFGKDSFEVCYKVHAPSHGMRLDQYLQTYFPSFSRQQIKEKIKNGEVIIKGRPGKHKPNTKVYENDHVTAFVHKTNHEDEWWKDKKLPLQMVPEIIYEDDGTFVISKPPYMSTHPTGKHLFNCATVYLESLTNKTVHSVHRIDRETSGVLVLAKNPKSARELTQCFENNQVSKCYFFIAVANQNDQGIDELDANERLDTGGEGLKRVVIGHYPEESDIGKVAKTHFSILHRQGKYILGLAFPVTGRQHQIRVHAMAHGFPLLGDKIYYGSYEMFQRFKDRYASSDDYDFMEISRHALHATALNLPFKGSRKTFYSPIPEDLMEWIKEKMSITPEELEKRSSEKINNYFKQADK